MKLPKAESYVTCLLIVVILSIGVIVLAQMPKTIASSNDVAFAWDVVTNATNYHIQWSTNSSIWPKNQFVYIGKTNRATAVNLPTTRCYARIKADGFNTTSPWSQPIPFNVPTSEVITFSLRYRPNLTNVTMILWTKSETNPPANSQKFYDLIYEKRYE